MGRRSAHQPGDPDRGLPEFLYRDEYRVLQLSGLRRDGRGMDYRLYRVYAQERLQTDRADARGRGGLGRALARVGRAYTAQCDRIVVYGHEYPGQEAGVAALRELRAELSQGVCRSGGQRL